MKAEEPTENYKTGWISIYRSLQNKGWYKKSEFIHLWIHILIKANHENCEFWFNGKNIKLKKGQFITGRKKLSSETGINESKIERILKVFESEQQIEQQKSNRNRIITIVSYNMYQKVEQQTEQQLNNKRTTSEQQVNTDNNNNNYNNKNKNIPTYSDFMGYAVERTERLSRSLDLDLLELKYESWVENKWKDGNNVPIKNWKSKLLNTLQYLSKQNKDENKPKVFDLSTLKLDK